MVVDDGAPTTPVSGLLSDLMAVRKKGDGSMGTFLSASTERLRGDAAYARAVRDELVEAFDVEHIDRLLTEEGVLTDEGLLAGVTRRVTSRLAPDPEDELVSPRYARRASKILRELESDDALIAWFEALYAHEPVSEVVLAHAILLLGARITGSGLEPRLIERVPDRADWTAAFLELGRVLDKYAHARFGGDEGVDIEEMTERMVTSIATCAQQIAALREIKRSVGTSLRLSSATLRIKQQLTRLRTLVACATSEERARATVRLLRELAEVSAERAPAFSFAAQKLELLAYLAVGHAAKKGEGYAARDTNGYRKFVYKSLGGGAIVSVFACLKLYLSHLELPIVPQGFVYGLNYAICFVFIYLAGATLATKQPALTASRLSQALEGGPDAEEFAPLVRSIARSQFISFVGNILGAGTCALIIAGALDLLFGVTLLSEKEALYLIAKLHPTESGTVFYAAIAGVLLSVAGFIAGAIDNGVVFHHVGDRVRAGRGAMRLIPGPLRGLLAPRVDSGLGALSGNVILGFLLGSAGSFGLALGLPIDIRHIAFASSHSALAFVFSDEARTFTTLATLGLAVAAIGFINFIVSFSLTLGVAISARRVQGSTWRGKVVEVWGLLRAHPGAFFLPLADDSTPSTPAKGA